MSRSSGLFYHCVLLWGPAVMFEAECRCLATADTHSTQISFHHFVSERHWHQADPPLVSFFPFAFWLSSDLTFPKDLFTLWGRMGTKYFNIAVNTENREIFWGGETKSWRAAVSWQETGDSWHWIMGPSHCFRTGHNLSRPTDMTRAHSAPH